jgi:hypothetical protein
MVLMVELSRAEMPLAGKCLNNSKHVTKYAVTNTVVIINE